MMWSLEEVGAGVQVTPVSALAQGRLPPSQCGTHVAEETRFDGVAALEVANLPFACDDLHRLAEFSRVHEWRPVAERACPAVSRYSLDRP